MLSNFINADFKTSGPPEILPEEITYEESDLVGHGSFGSVYKGIVRLWSLYGFLVANVCRDRKVQRSGSSSEGTQEAKTHNG